MIIQYIDALKKLRVVLASSSPRRLSLLQSIGLSTVEVRASDFAEDLDKSLFPSGGEYALSTARCKAEDVVKHMEAESVTSRGSDAVPFDILLAADTVVSLPTTPLMIIEKARDAAHARAILHSLSGTTHQVSTGVVLLYCSAHTGKLARREFIAVTTVHIADLCDELIDAFVATPSNWVGKAGAYGIQDGAMCFVEGIEGDFCNVMGLPLQRVCAEIADLITSGDIAL